jgi:hypothetical protein
MLQWFNEPAATVRLTCFWQKHLTIHHCAWYWIEYALAIPVAKRATGRQDNSLLPVRLIRLMVKYKLEETKRLVSLPLF